MTTSSLFLDEMAQQVKAARHELVSARSRGDEAGVRSAAGRLDELDDLLARATDTALRTVPSLL